MMDGLMDRRTDKVITIRPPSTSFGGALITVAYSNKKNFKENIQTFFLKF